MSQIGKDRCASRVRYTGAFAFLFSFFYQRSLECNIDLATANKIQANFK